MLSPFRKYRKTNELNRHFMTYVLYQVFFKIGHYHIDRKLLIVTKRSLKPVNKAFPVNQCCRRLLKKILERLFIILSMYVLVGGDALDQRIHY